MGRRGCCCPLEGVRPVRRQNSPSPGSQTQRCSQHIPLPPAPPAAPSTSRCPQHLPLPPPQHTHNPAGTTRYSWGPRVYCCRWVVVPAGLAAQTPLERESGGEQQELTWKGRQGSQGVPLPWSPLSTAMVSSLLSFLQSFPFSLGFSRRTPTREDRMFWDDLSML